MKAEEEMPSTAGDAVIWAVIRASAHDPALLITKDGTEIEEEDMESTLHVWKANAAEQIEAALDEIGWKVVRK